MKNVHRSVEPSPTGIPAHRRDTISHLIAQRNSLVDRLETGSRQIEQMRMAGENVEQWERFWVRLLHQYEQLCDRLRDLEKEQELRKAS